MGFANCRTLQSSKLIYLIKTIRMRTCAYTSSKRSVNTQGTELVRNDRITKQNKPVCFVSDNGVNLYLRKHKLRRVHSDFIQVYKTFLSLRINKLHHLYPLIMSHYPANVFSSIY